MVVCYDINVRDISHFPASGFNLGRSSMIDARDMIPCYLGMQIAISYFFGVAHLWYDEMI